jgi:type I pantothenate kinase
MNRTQPAKPPRRPPALFHAFRRQDWAALRSSATLMLSDADLQALCGLNESISSQEVADVYLPLSNLIGLHMAATQTLNRTIQRGFLALPLAPHPYVIGVAGSVAVGKSTFSRLLQAILSSTPGLSGAPAQPKVALIATDGFLYPTKVLEERGLMRRKGFPESYDLRRMLAFLIALKAGERRLQVPVYSHHSYDIVPDRFQLIDQPDVVIFEGLNVLQTASTPVVASDYFDFSVYLDADPASIERWYIERFLLLQRTAFQDARSYFHHHKDLTAEQAREVAIGIWREINLPNLRSNIEPTRERAALVLRKGVAHAIEEIWLRRV